MDIDNQAKTDPAKTQSMRTETLGPIGPLSLLILPKGWQKGLSRDNARGYVYSFSPAGHTDVTISVVYNVPPLSDQEGAALAAILKQEPHKVTVEQLSALQRLLKEKLDAFAFDVESAHTENVGTKRVLIVSGKYKDQNVSTFALYNQAGNDHRVVQQVQYTAYQRVCPVRERRAASHSSLLTALVAPVKCVSRWRRARRSSLTRQRCRDNPDFAKAGISGFPGRSSP